MKVYKTKNSQLSAEFKQKRYKDGLCTNCGQPRDDSRILCKKCRDAHNAYLKQRAKERYDNGICQKCDEPIINGSKWFCLKHWFEKISLDGTGTVKNGPMIERLLNRQHYRCAYTGKELILGKNAQLDHKIPIELGGNNEIHNLHWVDAEINRMKGKRTHNEFIDLCKLIATIGNQSVEAQVFQTWE